MKKVCVICPDKSEDIELLVPVDLWNRAGIKVEVYAYNKDKKISLSYSKLNLETLGSVNEIPDLLDYDAIFLPGGPGWRTFLNPESVEDGRFNLKEELDFYWKEKKDGYIVAICGAPVAVAKILDDKNIFFTSHSSQEYIGDLDKQWVNKKVNICKNFISGQNAGCAMDLGLAVIEKLIGIEKAEEIAKKMLINYPGIENYKVL